MARRNAVLEVNTFVKGLITEASPLTFPDNASLDEDNFVLRRDGSRGRRLGMDYEDSYQEITTGISAFPTGELAISTYSWKNAGGLPSRTLVAVQTGDVLKFFDADVTPLSTGEVGSFTLTGVDSEQIFSYASVDGFLIVATGAKPVEIFEFDGASITKSQKNIRTRDLFGVEDKQGSTDLTSGSGLSIRPSSLSQAHRYNLRNQSWAVPRERGNSSRTVDDTITYFRSTAGEFPSNSDSVTRALYANANDQDNRTGDQFFAEDLEKNPVGSFPSAKGFFIIDALERGSSRLTEVQALESEYSVLDYPTSSLPTDKTPGGATSVAEYAGRVWYGGFSSDLIGGDEKSPRLASYVFYSKLVQNFSDISECYQEGDPTSLDSPDLVDTDGGFIRVDGAYNIQALVNIGEGVLVLAENGVWMITGGSDFGFTANSNMRRKITENGAQSPGSVVVMDNTVMYWADDAIYHIAPNQFGDYEAKNLTNTTIQSFYDEISPADKFYAKGVYDSYDRKVRWVYQNRVEGNNDSRELVLDLNLGAFYTATIKGLGDGVLPKLIAPFEIPPFRLSSFSTDVVYQGELVEYNGEQVGQTVSTRGAATREVGYIVLTSTAPVDYTFALYKDSTFTDWASEDGTGIDAPAFLVTGYANAGEFLRVKQAPYIQFYFTRTEDGFTEDETGNLFPTNESSCIVQAQWDWANSANSNRWGRPFQAYRYKRLYSPANASDPFDNGFEVIQTKNKLRGKGKVLSLKMTTEAGKDCRLLGWSVIIGANQNV